MGFRQEQEVELVFRPTNVFLLKLTTPHFFKNS
jgi:hypothetical protein